MQSKVDIRFSVPSVKKRPLAVRRVQGYIELVRSRTSERTMVTTCWRTRWCREVWRHRGSIESTCRYTHQQYIAWRVHSYNVTRNKGPRQRESITHDLAWVLYSLNGILHHRRSQNFLWKMMRPVRRQLILSSIILWVIIVSLLIYMINRRQQNVGAWPARLGRQAASPVSLMQLCLVAKRMISKRQQM